MAVTGVFAADFLSFYDAVQKAEVHLKSFETGAGKVESSLNRMADSFSGRKIIQEATLMTEAIERSGGVTKLTGAELERAGAKAAEAAEKMRALGMDVPPGIQRIADAAGTAEQKTSMFGTAFGRLTASFTAANLIDRAVSSLIGWGTEAIKAASVTVNLAEKTGLSTTTIQQMAHVADQTGTSLDAFTTSAFQLGVRLDGGSGSVRAAVDRLGLSFEQLRSQSPDEQFNAITTALEQMENPQERNRIAILLFGKAGAEILPAIAKGYRGISDSAFIAGDAQIKAASDAQDAWAWGVSGLKLIAVEGFGTLAQAARAAGIAVGLASNPMDELKRKTIGVTDAARDASASTADWGSRLLAATEIVYGLEQSEIDLISTAIRLGATQEELTDQFGLTSDAVRVFNDRLREQADAQRAATEANDKAKRKLEELDAAYAKLNSSIFNEIGMVQMQDAAAALARQTENNVQLRLMERDAWQMEFAAVEKGLATEAAAAAAAQIAFDLETEALARVSAGHAAAGAAAKTGTGIATVGYAAVAQQVNLTSDAIRAMLQVTKFAAAANAILQENSLFTTSSQLQRISKIPTPSFAGGVENFSGGLARVHKDELLVNLPGGTSVIPRGGRGGGGVTNVYNFGISTVMGNPQEIVRVIKSALVGDARSLGQRVPVGV